MQIGVNMNWLLAGEGSMFLEGENLACSKSMSTDFYEEEETVLVPMTNLKLSAGSGVIWEEGLFTGELIPIPKKIIKRNSAKNLAGAEVKGDSMDPTLKYGELVFFLVFY